MPSEKRSVRVNRVYFYPHAYLRDRQLDTVRRWPTDQVVNSEIVRIRRGAQVSRTRALQGRIRRGLLQRVPLPNVKLRPKGLHSDTALYVWGSVAASGPFITDIDNPYAFVRYNLNGFRFWRPFFRRMLLAPRCMELRCMSEACRNTLGLVLGSDVASKAEVYYPALERQVPGVGEVASDGPRFLFVGTQFEIKGGAALVKAWRRVTDALPSATLDLITHLPRQYERAARETKGLRVHEAAFSRAEIWREFMARADVLVLPTYVESFGMVVLEALAHGLAVIATDVYALPELVEDGVNGRLVHPPLSIWDNYLPTSLYRELEHAIEQVARADTAGFEAALANAMIDVAGSREGLLSARRASLRLFDKRFARDSERGL